MKGLNLSGKDNIGAYLVQHFSSLFSTTNLVLDSLLSGLLEKVVTVEEKYWSLFDTG